MLFESIVDLEEKRDWLLDEESRCQPRRIDVESIVDLEEKRDWLLDEDESRDVVPRVVQSMLFESIVDLEEKRDWLLDEDESRDVTHLESFNRCCSSQSSI